MQLHESMEEITKVDRLEVTGEVIADTAEEMATIIQELATRTITPVRVAPTIEGNFLLSMMWSKLYR